MKAIRLHVVLLLLAAGCGGSDGTNVDLEDRGEADLEPNGAAGEGIRSRRRMDLDQLSASIQRATGGIGWTRNWDQADNFDVYAQTLGKPDYIGLTAEDLTPSLLFQKFLDDASREVCDALVQREITGGAEAILLAHVTAADTSLTAPDAVRQNLSGLLLRFHGRAIDAASPQIDPWVRLFDTSVTATGNPMAGWRAVCVGLFVHPDFYSY